MKRKKSLNSETYSVLDPSSNLCCCLRNNRKVLSCFPSALWEQITLYFVSLRKKQRRDQEGHRSWNFPYHLFFFCSSADFVHIQKKNGKIKKENTLTKRTKKRGNKSKRKERSEQKGGDMKQNAETNICLSGFFSSYLGMRALIAFTTSPPTRPLSRLPSSFSSTCV